MTFRNFSHGPWSNTVRLLPGRDVVAASGADETVRLWGLDGTLVRELGSGFGACAVAPAGARIAGFNGGGTVRVWDVDSGDEQELTGHPTSVPTYKTGANVTCAAFSPDGSVLATGGFDDTVRLWDLATGQERQRFDVSPYPCSLEFSPTGALLAVGTFKRDLRIIPLRDGAVRVAKASRKAVMVLRFAGEQLLAGGGGGEVGLWNLSGGGLRSRGRYGFHLGGVTDLAVCPRGKTVASVGHDGVINLWDIENGHRISSVQHDNSVLLSVAFTPDGGALLIGGPATPALYRLAGRRLELVATAGRLV